MIAYAYLCNADCGEFEHWETSSENMKHYIKCPKCGAPAEYLPQMGAYAFKADIYKQLAAKGKYPLEAGFDGERNSEADLGAAKVDAQLDAQLESKLDKTMKEANERGLLRGLY